MKTEKEEKKPENLPVGESDGGKEKLESGGSPEEREDPDPEVVLAETFAAYPQTLGAAREAGTFVPGEACATFLAAVEGFARGGNVAPEDIDASLAQLMRVGHAYGAGGAFTLDMLETLIKGLTHDRLLAEAEQAAELRGRNANIEAQMRRADQSDGLPHLNGTAPRRANRSRGIFSLAETAR